jgi:hypothetical protein
VSEDDAHAEPGPGDGIHRLMDQFVFAPIGALTAMKGDLEGSAERGRQRVELQLRNARFIGEMAVQHGSKEIVRRLKDLTGVGGSTKPERASDASEATVTAEPTMTEEPTAEAPAPIDHLIAGYDDLSASQVVRLLESFSPVELDELVAYESATRGRRTILNKAAQLLQEGA